MIFHDYTQGEEDWHDVRLGIPTASQFSRILRNKPEWVVEAGDSELSRHRSEEAAEEARKKWERKHDMPFDISKRWAMSDSAGGYMMELLGEWATGKAADSYQSQAMLRGRDLEPEARAAVEAMMDVTIHDGGIGVLDGGAAAASPDGLLRDDDGFITAGVEIKCFLDPAKHLMMLLGENVISDEYHHQLQGGMYVFGVGHWHSVSYYPGFPIAIHSVTRDDEWCESFAAALESFSERLEAKRKLLTIAGVKPAGGGTT